MIDWQLTTTKFNYSNPDDLIGIKRPKVVCRCDKCLKISIIAVRVKSRIVDGQMKWLCPSCVCLGRSIEISQNMLENWQDVEYKDNQLSIKDDPEYKALQSEKITNLWKSAIYRQKLEVGIRRDNYIDKCREKFGDQFDYDESSFKSWRSQIRITCKTCNTMFTKKPLQHLNIGYCPTCNTSSGQREIAEFIRSLGVDYVLNDRTKLNDAELDIFTDKLAVEYNGLYWHSHDGPETTKQRFRHQTKSLECLEKGIKLFQFFDYEWETQKNIVQSMIRNAYGLSKRLYARKLQFTSLTNQQAQSFFNKNHLQGFRPASITLALLLDGDIKIAMSFSKTKDGYEIMRLATEQNTQVIGGFNKLLSRFRETIKCPIYTFADLRYSTGNVYRKNGFKLCKITKPGYFYYNKSTMLSRQQCQKHKLRNLLGDTFNANMSESQNMFNAGFRRVWTAGNLLFSKIN